MTAGRVVVDLVAPQSPSYRERGIARHGIDFANALIERHPDLLDRILLHPELPPAGGLEHVIASGKASTTLEGIGPGGVYHVTSAFEPEVPVRRLWPRVASAQRMRLVVTVYDLIPDIFPDLYLVDPGLRRRWRACREIARVADRVLVLSESGAEDVVRLLGVPPERVAVIGAGCDDQFRPPTSRSAALARARAGVDDLGEHFMVYNAAIDPRKNLDRLMEAYVTLPAAVRGRWQLVLVCRADPLQVNHIRVMAERMGVAGRVLMAGYVSDETLVALYQSTDLSVFPSLYEGYGLPVIEAQACGARVVAGDNSSLVELVDAEARFDATDVAAIADAMQRGLTDEGLRDRLADAARRPRPTWEAVADRTAAVYRELLDTDQPRRYTPGWRHTTRVAVVSPLPDPSHGRAPTELETFGEALAHGFEEAGVPVDRFGDAPPDPGPARRRHGLLRPAALVSMDGWRSGYDLVVCCIGNDPVHLGTLAVLRRSQAAELPVVVIAHDVALGRLYEAAAEAGELGLDVAATLQEIYPGLPPDVGADGRLGAASVTRHGLVLAREMIGMAQRYLVASEEAARVARIDARPAHAGRVEVQPVLRLSTSTEALDTVGVARLSRSLLAETLR